MLCPLEKQPDGRWKCPLCDYQPRRKYAEAPRHECGSLIEPPVIGCGTELSKIFASLGIRGKCGHGCPEWQAKMNAWGPDGCVEHRAEIIEHLTTAYDSASVLTKMLAGANAVAQGLPLTLDGLLDLAIERTVESASIL